MNHSNTYQQERAHDYACGDTNGEAEQRRSRQGGETVMTAGHWWQHASERISCIMVLSKRGIDFWNTPWLSGFRTHYLVWFKFVLERRRRREFIILFCGLLNKKRETYVTQHDGPQNKSFSLVSFVQSSKYVSAGDWTPSRKSDW
jgi:hypothetical protein